MTTRQRGQVAVAQQAPVPMATRIGQGTSIEQSRAAAQVLASVQVAQQCPRNITAVVYEMEQVCGQLSLAERAFFSYNRGGGNVTGPSVHLARTLASIYGNLDYGLAELRRDDEYGQSEMRAYCWDKQKNVTSETLFIVPHMRDKKGGPVELTELRDIYENNANNGARRVREMIFAQLPPWFRDRAVEICRETLKRGGSNKRIDERISEMVAAFRELGVSVPRMEARVRREQALWGPDEVAELGIVFRSIQRREVTVDDAFPPERVTVDELVGAPAPVAKPARQRRQEPAAETAPTQAPTRLVNEHTGQTIVCGGLDTPIEYAADAVPEGYYRDDETGELIPLDAGVDPAQYADGRS